MKEGTSSRRASGAGTGKRRRHAYDASGRRAEADRTALRIVEAATDLIKAGAHPEMLSYADVAARAEVATRTVYRHFPTTTNLLAAVAATTLARFTDGQVASDRQQGVAQIARFHRGLADDPSLYQIFLVTPVRSGMSYTELVGRWYADVLERVPARHRSAVAATVELMTSPYAWDVMHTYWKLPPERITQTCLAGVQAVVDAFTRDPEQLDPAAPLPPMFQARGDVAPRGAPAAPRRSRKRSPTRKGDDR